MDLKRCISRAHRLTGARAGPRKREMVVLRAEPARALRSSAKFARPAIATGVHQVAFAGVPILRRKTTRATLTIARIRTFHTV